MGAASDDNWFVVVNPAAGGGKALRKWPHIADRLQRQGISFDVRITHDIAEVGPAVSAAISEGFRHFISVGGDGSHHTLINAAYPAPERLTMAIVPVGTGNDWARTFGIRRDIRQAVTHIVTGKVIRHALGTVTFDEGDRFRYFVNVLGCGLDGFVMQGMSRQPRRAGNTLIYLQHGIRALWKYRPGESTITCGDQQLRGTFITIHAGICRYSGGGMSFTPHADPCGRTLAVSCIRNAGHLALISNIPRLYLGTIARYRQVVTLAAPGVIVTDDHLQNLPVEADGEYLGTGSFEAAIIPGAFDLIVPERWTDKSR